MSHPSERLKELLRESPEEASVERTWRAIERARHGGGSTSRERGWALAASTAAFFVATTALGMGAWKVWREVSQEARAVEQTPDASAQTPSSLRRSRRSPVTPQANAPEIVVPEVVPEVRQETPSVSPSAGTSPRVRTSRESTEPTSAPAPANDVPRSSPSELLAAADETRLAGRPLDAVASLEQLLTEHASSSEAPLAAVSLGRIELDVLRRPQRAASAYARALALGVPRELDENVRYRLAIAYDRAGLRSDATRAARAYLEAYPNGSHVDDMRRLGEVR